MTAASRQEITVQTRVWVPPSLGYPTVFSPTLLLKFPLGRGAICISVARLDISLKSLILAKENVYQIAIVLYNISAFVLEKKK